MTHRDDAQGKGEMHQGRNSILQDCIAVAAAAVAYGSSRALVLITAHATPMHNCSATRWCVLDHHVLHRMARVYHVYVRDCDDYCDAYVAVCCLGKLCH